MTFGYLAQPIDQAGNTNRRSRLKQLVGLAESLAADSQIDLYRPANAYRTAGAELGRGTTSAIDTINSTALGIAEVLFAVIPHGIATLGTPVEIERALGRGLPVVIVTDSRMYGKSVQIDAWANQGALVVYDSDWLDHMEACRGVRALLRTPRQPLPVATEAPGPALPYVRADPSAGVPSKAYGDDAGLDLAACESVVIPGAGGRALVRTGLKFAIPTGYWGLIVGRSSTWAKRGLDVKLGVIDAGWRGELFISVHNPGAEDVKVEVGERLAQYILLPAWMGPMGEVRELPPHERGENGFGSSGR